MTVAVLLRRLQGRPGAAADDEALGRCERGALATALGLGAATDAPVVAIAVGPARREDRVLAMALRAGCARAVRISDDGLEELDYLGLAQVLAAAARWVDADVVVCGDRSEEEGTGAVGPAVAELLGAAHLTAVATARPDGGPRAPLVVERVGAGGVERFRVQAPVVLCVRPPAIRARAAAGTGAPPGDAAVEGAAPGPSRGRAAAIEELGLARLGLDLRQLHHRRTAAGRLRPVRGPRRTVLVASAGDLIARLRADHLAPPGPIGAAAAAAPPRAARDEDDA